ncbi:hypothetical protein TI39_contig553g00016 [Zymoseptoria brevis]|uniref:SET domain-containing protein n=1 Tax=Zymoseptoria brevis TaxID=1047168 RepID=A0A0F4GIP3_9PEZI|nr:hypothetical protein TI39_contig553g00016 [Zymoseptoria brevis]
MAETSPKAGALREVINSSKTIPSDDTSPPKTASAAPGNSTGHDSAISCKDSTTSSPHAAQQASADNGDVPDVSTLQLGPKHLCDTSAEGQFSSIAERSAVKLRQRDEATTLASAKTATPAQSDPLLTGAHSSAAVSASSTRSQSVASGPSCRSTALSATASPFVPSPPTSSTEHGSLPAPLFKSQLFELRETLDKGLGLFAVCDISAGTRIICETPMLEIPQNQLHSAWLYYCKLTPQAKAIYDALCDFAPSNLDFDQAVRIPNDYPDKAGMWAAQVHAMKIFSVNSFRLYNGHLGVFALASRLNHSCVPNVHFHSNAQLGKSTVHAARDIQAGEELLGNYIGAQIAYKTRAQRTKHLHLNYGFLCQCPACSDITGTCDRRREALTLITWGLNEFKNNSSAEQHDGHPFFPSSPQAALAQAEDAVNILKGERLFTLELSTAYHFASDFALECEEWEKAVKYAFSQHDVEKTLLGSDVDDREYLGITSAQWIKEVQTYMSRKNGKHKLSKKFWLEFADHKSLWTKLENEAMVERKGKQPVKQPDKKPAKKSKNARVPKRIAGRGNKQTMEINGAEPVGVAAGKTEGAAA